MARTGRPKAELVLTDEEREQLVGWSRRAKSAQSLAVRSKIVLSCSQGLDNIAVAAKLGVVLATVSKCRSDGNALSMPTRRRTSFGATMVRSHHRGPSPPATVDVAAR
jgi:hypothetical protein